MKRLTLIAVLMVLLGAWLYAQSPVRPDFVTAANPNAVAAATPCYIKAGVGTVNDTTNHANCKATAGNFFGIRAINTTATIAYLKMYNLATDPTCSSATGFVEAIPIPANAASTGAGLIDANAELGFQYSAGIGYCVTGGGTSTDNSAPVAGVYITIKLK